MAPGRGMRKERLLVTRERGVSWVIPPGTVRAGRETITRSTVTARTEDWVKLNDLIRSRKDPSLERYFSDIGEFNFSEYCRSIFTRELDRLEKATSTRSDRTDVVEIVVNSGELEEEARRAAEEVAQDLALKRRQRGGGS